MKFTDSIRLNAADGTAVGSLFVDANADYLADHFPGAPMLPGLVMLEAAVRTATALWCERQTAAVSAPVLHRVDRLHIVRRVVPGETLTVEAALVAGAVEEGAVVVAARGHVGGETAMRARFRLRPIEECRKGTAEHEH